ncbi:MAG: GIY-YIG nuclease family protein [Chitinophagales bacterium]|nr:GIY-YIG nuclease family protein [Chitinophagales bacterium]
MYFIYILYSASANKYYVGHTDNLERRLFEHNNGMTRFTSNIASDWNIMYTETFESRTLAAKREREIKARKSRVYIQSLIAKVG